MFFEILKSPLLLPFLEGKVVLHHVPINKVVVNKLIHHRVIEGDICPWIDGEI